MTEKDWATQLKKEKYLAQGKKQVPLALRIKQTQEEVEYFKQLLKQILENKEYDKVEDVLKKLISLRGRQLSLFQQNFTANYGALDQAILNQQVRMYFQDCNHLVMAVDAVLNKQHA